jgi:hypothetical protein
VTGTAAPSSPNPGGVALDPPPVTPELEAFARTNPGHQAYVIDPEYDPNGGVPGWAIRGYYPVTASGTIDRQGWVANPQYRPGPITRGFPRPRNRVERALQLAAAGHQPDSVLLTELAAAQVVIPTSDEHPTQVPVLTEDGQDTIVMFTAAEDIDARTPRVAVAVKDLLPLLSTVSVLVINPGSVPSARLTGASLAAAVAAAFANQPGINYPGRTST